MEKRIHLKFLRNSHYDYLGMHIPEKMEVSELLKIIRASELLECNPCSGQIKSNKAYKSSGKLEDRRTYKIHTNDLDRTWKLIKSYNNNN